jgi:hypothetical protein
MTGTDVHDPLRALGGTRRAFVVPELKILYISVAKNACTTIKWLVAELAGEDPAQFRLGVGPYVTKDEGIHVRSRWKHTPTLNEIPTEMRAQIHPDNGWFVFGVVRDPRPRLFSAWQNKFLMRNPAYIQWRDEPWYPRIPQTPEHVVEDFATFVELMHTHPDAPVLDDAHFQQQVPYLAEDVVPYSAVYDIGRLGVMRDDLEAHVRAQGWTGDVRLGRSNDTPLRATADVFAGPVRERVDAFFSDDLERYGHLWDVSRLESVPPWSSDAMAALRAQIALSERICELIGLVKQARRGAGTKREARIDRLTLQLQRAQAENQRLRLQSRDATWKRALRPAVRRVRARLQR